jgi:hypothetical protein
MFIFLDTPTPFRKASSAVFYILLHSGTVKFTEPGIYDSNIYQDRKKISVPTGEPSGGLSYRIPGIPKAGHVPFTVPHTGPIHGSLSNVSLSSMIPENI